MYLSPIFTLCTLNFVIFEMFSQMQLIVLIIASVQNKLDNYFRCQLCRYLKFWWLNSVFITYFHLMYTKFCDFWDVFTNAIDCINYRIYAKQIGQLFSMLTTWLFQLLMTYFHLMYTEFYDFCDVFTNAIDCITYNMPREMISWTSGLTSDLT